MDAELAAELASIEEETEGCVTPRGIVVGQGIGSLYISDQMGHVVDIQYDDVDSLIQALRSAKAKCDCDHAWKRTKERYGEDADGNRGTWVEYERCTKCGDER